MTINEILLIDDNYVDNFINKKIISKEKITETITEKLSPIEALEYLEFKKNILPELIFLDIKMPQMDGFEFIDEFSKFSNFQHAKRRIVMLTSSYNTVDIEAAKNNPHVLEYVIKPLDQSKLNAVLKLLA